MIGSNPIFSTKLKIGAEKALFGVTVTESVTNSCNSDLKPPYTAPFISTGKEPSKIPRGSTKLEQIAKNKWFVEFNFYDKRQLKMVRIRLSKHLNRIKEYHEKLKAFLELQAICINDLKDGWNPLNPIIVQEEEPVADLMLSDAVESFLGYQRFKGNWPKTIESYRCKLRLFIGHVGNVEVKRINDLNITDFLNTCERQRLWTGVTYNFARITLNNFFVYLMRYKFVDTNPRSRLEGIKNYL